MRARGGFDGSRRLPRGSFRRIFLIFRIWRQRSSRHLDNDVLSFSAIDFAALLDVLNHHVINRLAVAIDDGRGTAGVLIAVDMFALFVDGRIFNGFVDNEIFHLFFLLFISNMLTAKLDKISTVASTESVFERSPFRRRRVLPTPAIRIRAIRIPAPVQ